MQRLIPALSLLAAVILGGLAWHFHSQLVERDSRIASLTADADAARRAEKAARDEAEPMRANVARLTNERDNAQLAASAASATVPGAEEKPKDAGELIGGLLGAINTPEMRTMMRTEAVGSARKEYAKLIKQWGLSGAEAEQLVHLLAEREGVEGMDMLDVLGGGKTDEGKFEEVMKKAETKSAETKKQIQSLLGEQKFAELEAFEKKRDEEAVVEGYAHHFDAAGVSLNDTQRATLAKILTEEAGSGAKERELAEGKLLIEGATDADLEKHKQSQEAYHAKVVQRAAGVLSPDQVAAFQNGLKEELEQQAASMKLVRGMLKGGTAPGAIKVEIKK